MASNTVSLATDKARILSTNPGTSKFWRGDNTWSNTLDGAFTCNSTLTVNAENSTTEGGQICLKADPNHSAYHAYLDVCNNYFRVHSNGAERLSLNLSSNGLLTVNGPIKVGIRETTSSPSSLTYSNRITIVPYFHTGGPWYIKSGDDASNAHLALFYNTSNLIQIRHNAYTTIGDSVCVTGSAWGAGTTMIGKNGTDKIIIGYLASSTTGAVVGAHASTLQAWATLNLSGSAINFRMSETLCGKFLDGCLCLTPTTGNYREGIRIKPTGSWTTIVLGGNDLTADSGTSANSWTIHNNNGTFYINKNASSAAGNPRAMATSTGWTFGNTTLNSYALNTASFICASWIRTKGSTGWYNEDYAGGWYMTDAKWVRTYNSKPIILDIGTNNAYGIGGHRLALAMVGGSHVSWIMKGGSVIYGFCVNGNGNWYFGRRTNDQSLETTTNDAYGYYGDNVSILPNGDNVKILGNSSNRWKEVRAVTFYGALSGNASSASQLYVTGSSGTQYLTGVPEYATKNQTQYIYSPCYMSGGYLYAYGFYATGNTYPTLKLTRTDSGETSIYWQNATAGWAAGISVWSVGAGGFGIGQYSGTGSSAWRFRIDNSGYCYASSRLYNAVWNDFAEFRQSTCKEPGRIVVDDGHGCLHLCTTRLASGARAISDTYGSSVGYSLIQDTPIGIGGRVLVYTYQNRNNYKVGDAVCSAPNGTIDIMSREEIKEYPDRIIGIVSEIPEYEIWTQQADEISDPIYVEVKNRIWIYVK